MDIKIYRNKKIAGRIVDGEFCLLNPETSELMILNETGTLIWKNIETSKTVTELVEIIFKEYESTREKIESDIKTFIEKLQNSKMVELK